MVKHAQPALVPPSLGSREHFPIIGPRLRRSTNASNAADLSASWVASFVGIARLQFLRHQCK